MGNGSGSAGRDGAGAAGGARMRLHVVLPDESAAMDVGAVAALAREAEALGYAGVWLPDHVLPPGPYGVSTGYGGVYEALTTLSYLAAVTERVTLGTSVLVAPLRDPLILARQTATLARLSGGRFVLGVGVGWERYEFEAAGADYAARGARTNSTLRVVRQLHTRGGGPYADAFVSFDERAVFEPVPRTPVPFLIGGNSDAALRRAVEFGGYWQAVFLTPAEFAARRKRIEELVREAEPGEGGHRSAEGAGEGAGPRVSAGARTDWDGPGRSAADVRAEVARWEAAGAEDLAVWFGAADDGFTVRMRALAAETGLADGRITRPRPHTS
ncbi:TIGR03619 family F420-dependent LLM class oxidoreductase [Streptomyces celluloflavus]|uniref:TIGR03619 family F420-dependent LLM class oxidoreductase n=1 Tax=Streptomyces celluloflavus TaxID=58344 RepID=UPI00367644E2